MLENKTIRLIMWEGKQYRYIYKTDDLVLGKYKRIMVVYIPNP